MINLTRRQFGGTLLAATQAAPRLFGKSASTGAIAKVLRDGIQNRQIPCVTAMCASTDSILYSGAFGKRDSASGIDVKPDSIFAIASMTKAMTSAAAMQLVERGRLKLDEPVARHLPEVAKMDVLTGFDAAGKPVLRPATRQITLRHLL